MLPDFDLHAAGKHLNWQNFAANGPDCSIINSKPVRNVPRVERVEHEG